MYIFSHFPFSWGFGGNYILCGKLLFLGQSRKRLLFQRTIQRSSKGILHERGAVLAKRSQPNRWVVKSALFSLFCEFLILLKKAFDMITRLLNGKRKIDKQQKREKEILVLMKKQMEISSIGGRRWVGWASCSHLVSW